MTTRAPPPRLANARGGAAPRSARSFSLLSLASTLSSVSLALSDRPASAHGPVPDHAPHPAPLDPLLLRLPPSPSHRPLLDRRQAQLSSPSVHLQGRQDELLDHERRRLRASSSSSSSTSSPGANADTPASLPRYQSEIVTDHNNVKNLYERYKTSTSKDEKATLVNTSAFAFPSSLAHSPRQAS